MSLSNPHKNWNHLEYFNKKNSICQRGWTEATPKKHHTLTKLPQLEHSILNLSIKVGWQLLKGGRSGKIPWFEIVHRFWPKNTTSQRQNPPCFLGFWRLGVIVFFKESLVPKKKTRICPKFAFSSKTTPTWIQCSSLHWHRPKKRYLWRIHFFWKHLLEMAQHLWSAKVFFSPPPDAPKGPSGFADSPLEPQCDLGDWPVGSKSDRNAGKDNGNSTLMITYIEAVYECVCIYKISDLTDIFQMGWNHQPVNHFMKAFWNKYCMYYVFMRISTLLVYVCRLIDTFPVNYTAWNASPNKGENKVYLKPPPRLTIL